MAVWAPGLGTGAGLSVRRSVISPSAGIPRNGCASGDTRRTGGIYNAGMTWYITLCAPAGAAARIPAQPVLDFLATQPELQAQAAMVFANRPGQPWVQVVLAKTGANGGYCVDGTFVPEIDVIELICSSAYHEPLWYDRLAARIAAFLQWQAVEEYEDRCIWPLG